MELALSSKQLQLKRNSGKLQCTTRNSQVMTFREDSLALGYDIASAMIQ